MKRTRQQISKIETTIETEAMAHSTSTGTGPVDRANAVLAKPCLRITALGNGFPDANEGEPTR